MEYGRFDGIDTDKSSICTNALLYLPQQMHCAIEQDRNLAVQTEGQRLTNKENNGSVWQCKFLE